MCGHTHAENADVDPATVIFGRGLKALTARDMTANAHKPEDLRGWPSDLVPLGRRRYQASQGHEAKASRPGTSHRNRAPRRVLRSNLAPTIAGISGALPPASSPRVRWSGTTSPWP